MSISTRKTNRHGKGKYLQGNFFSAKNEENFPYKSSYELAFLNIIEKDEKIIKYLYEPFELYYIDSEGKQRIYRPDFMLLYSCGKIEITEIKPKIMLKDYDVQAKAKSCRAYLEENYKNINISYKFVTEKDLFNSTKEYTDFVKSAK